MDLVELNTPDGRRGLVEPKDVERRIAEGWTRPVAPPAPAASIPARAPRAHRTEPPTASPVDPS